jgi:hypothetical protein
MAMPAPYEDLHKETNNKRDISRLRACGWQGISDILAFSVS